MLTATLRRSSSAAMMLAGTNRSSTAKVAAGASGRPLMPQYLTQVRFEDRGRLFELIGEACEMLQLADRFLGLAHAFGRRVHLAAEEIRILPVHCHFGERLYFSFDPIELDRDEVGILLC